MAPQRAHQPAHGITLGLFSGFLGSRLDIIMVLVNVMLAAPQLILAFAMVVVLGTEIGTIILVLGLAGWKRYALVVCTVAVL